MADHKNNATKNIEDDDAAKADPEDVEGDEEYVEGAEDQDAEDIPSDVQEGPVSDEDEEAEASGSDGDEAAEEEEDEEDEILEVGEEDEEDEEAESKGTKRSQPETSQAGSSKKQKQENGGTKNGSAEMDTSKPYQAAASGKVGSKHDDPKDADTQGSKDRLPKQGQQVEWKSLPGYVDGEVVEILTEAKEVDGKEVKASADDPRIVLKSNKSGKICVHKPEAIYFD
ncbi:hypothetical protein F4780DRAFT_786705 [Xylariomycetidae sp. FL0641]|nr:hypothetical protein F4780DRAFT_786705 [Xylariomycetidae sp. FL0641]